MRETLTDHMTNQFYSPLSSVLIKGVEEDGKWIVYLQASNEMKDQDGETVEMTALKKAADYFMSHGVLSWDHKHKVTNDPGFIIGEPLDVKFTPRGETLVKGFLYKGNDIAQKVWKNINSGARRLGASIGGGILQKAESTIKQVVWDETALTHKPVNDMTLGTVQVVPFAAFAKALTAGSGVNAAMFTGGRAMTPESLQGAGAVRDRDLRSLFSDFLIAIRKGRIRDYNDMLNFIYDRGYEGDTAVRLVNYIARKVPDVVRQGSV
jgi:hypothetical protein